MIVFVESYGVVRFGAIKPLFGHQFSGFPVDDVDHTVILRDADENARPLLFQLNDSEWPLLPG
jgi:hypothetical protein